MTGAVVKFPGDTSSFIVLGLLQAARQFSKLFRLLEDFYISLLKLMSANPYLVFEFAGEYTKPLFTFAQSQFELFLLRNVIVRFQDKFLIPAVTQIERPTAGNYDLAAVFARVKEFTTPATIAMELFGNSLQRLREFGL